MIHEVLMLDDDAPTSVTRCRISTHARLVRSPPLEVSYNKTGFRSQVQGVLSTIDWALLV